MDSVNIYKYNISFGRYKYNISIDIIRLVKILRKFDLLIENSV